jgi:hypothetical protein
MASRYEMHFGTLDKVAVYFAASCFQSDGSACEYCPLIDCDETLRKVGSFVSVQEKIAEWLRGDA